MRMTFLWGACALLVALSATAGAARAQFAPGFRDPNVRYGYGAPYGYLAGGPIQVVGAGSFQYSYTGCWRSVPTYDVNGYPMQMIINAC